eukprot:689417-Rhodomonas_salina.1
MSSTDIGYVDTRSSMILGTVAGSLVDAIGRKAGCMAFAVLYALSGLHSEIQYKKPRFQHNFYQQCCFLHLISHSTPLRARYAMPGTDLPISLRDLPTRSLCHVQY